MHNWHNAAILALLVLKYDFKNNIACIDRFCLGNSTRKVNINYMQGLRSKGKTENIDVLRIDRQFVTRTSWKCAIGERCGYPLKCSC